MARAFGVATEEEAAASLMERLIFRLGGAHLYLPKRTAKERQRVSREIVQRFNGRNLFELAREYDLTPSMCGGFSRRTGRGTDLHISRTPRPPNGLAVIAGAHGQVLIR